MILGPFAKVVAIVNGGDSLAPMLNVPVSAVKNVLARAGNRG